MFNLFKTIRENARKAAEYDAIARLLDEANAYSRFPHLVSIRVGFVIEDREAFLRAWERAEDKIARMTSGLKQFQPKAAAEKKVDA